VFAICIGTGVCHLIGAILFPLFVAEYVVDFVMAVCATIILVPLALEFHAGATNTKKD
jgi:hypothetical protein